MKIIFDYNRTIFNPDTNNLYDGALEVLQNLSITHELFLVSKNEYNRENMMKTLGINDYFKKIVLVDNKTVDIFTELVGEDKNVLIVGDRIKGEIYLGNLLGFNTVWVKQGKFSNDIYANEKEKPNYIINELRELLKIIEKYE